MRINKQQRLFPHSELRAVLTGSKKSVETSEKYFATNLLRSNEKEKFIHLYLSYLEATQFSTDRDRTVARRLVKRFHSKAKNHELSQVNKDQLMRVMQLYSQKYKLAEPTLPVVTLPLEERRAVIKQAAINAKEMEWKAVAQAYRDAASRFLAAHKTEGASLSAILSGQSLPNPKQQYALKIERALARQAYLSDSPMVHKQEVKKIVDRYPEKPALLTDAEYQDYRAAIESFKYEFRLLEQDVSNLVAICEELEVTNLDAQELVLLLKDRLRIAFSRPAYKLCSSDEQNLFVQFLHTLAAGGFSGAKNLAPYLHFGQKIFSVANISPDVPLHEVLARSFQAVKESWDKSFAYEPQTAIQRLLKKITFSVNALLKSNLPQAIVMGNIARRIFSLGDEFSNNSGALVQERFTVNGKAVSATNVLGPAVVLGGEVDPIFEAILQASTNRYFQKVANDPSPIHGVVYSNLQQWENPDEGKNCVKLMELAQQYPFSFKAITVFHHFPNERQIGAMKEILNEKTRDDFYQFLIQDSHFTLTPDPKRRYFFPTAHKQEWKLALKQIVNSAYEVVNPRKIPFVDKKRAAAFYELIKLGIIRYHEAKAMSETRDLPDNAEVLHCRICKSGVDRAGKTNAEMLWALGEENSDRFVSAAFHSRAVLSKGRLVLEGHHNHFISLATYVAQDQLKKYLNFIQNLAVGDKNLQFHGLRLLYDDAWQQQYSQDPSSYMSDSTANSDSLFSAIRF